jgi:hypothetical protein
MAGIGGALGYIYRETRAGRAIRFARILLTSALAAFIGYHMIFVYQSLGLSEQMTGALNGLTALLGVEFALFLFQRIVLKQLGFKYDEKVTDALIAAGWTPPASNNTRNNSTDDISGVEQDTDVGEAKRELS